MTPEPPDDNPMPPKIFARLLAKIRSPHWFLRGGVVYLLYFALLLFVASIGETYRLDGLSAILMMGLTGVVMMGLWWAFQPPIGCLASGTMLLSGLCYIVPTHGQANQGFVVVYGMFWLGVAFWIISFLRATLGEGKQQTQRVKDAFARTRLLFNPPAGEEETLLVRASDKPQQDTFLRPAQGAGASEEHVLLRPGSSEMEGDK